MNETEIAGRLRERVLLQEPEATPDGAGGRLVTWRTLATVSAALEAEPQSRRLLAGRAAHPVRYTVHLRTRTDVVPAMRLLWRNRELLIEAVEPHTINQSLMTVLAREAPGT